MRAPLGDDPSRPLAPWRSCRRRRRRRCWSTAIASALSKRCSAGSSQVRLQSMWSAAASLALNLATRGRQVPSHGSSCSRRPRRASRRAFGDVDPALGVGGRARRRSTRCCATAGAAARAGAAAPAHTAQATATSASSATASTRLERKETARMPAHDSPRRCDPISRKRVYDAGATKARSDGASQTGA